MSVSIERELKTLLKTGRYTLGAKTTLSALKAGRVKLVIMAENAPAETRLRARYYSKLSGVPVVVYRGTSVDLGLAVGKPFKVSMIGVIEAGDSRILEVAGSRE